MPGKDGGEGKGCNWKVSQSFPDWLSLVSWLTLTRHRSSWFSGSPSLVDEFFRVCRGASFFPVSWCGKYQVLVGSPPRWATWSWLMYSHIPWRPQQVEMQAAPCHTFCSSLPSCSGRRLDIAHICCLRRVPHSCKCPQTPNVFSWWLVFVFTWEGPSTLSNWHEKGMLSEYYAPTKTGNLRETPLSPLIFLHKERGKGSGWRTSAAEMNRSTSIRLCDAQVARKCLQEEGE